MALTASEVIARLWKMPDDDPLPRTREWVYFLEFKGQPPIIKIGKTSQVKWRLITLQYTSPVALHLIAVVNAPAGTERVLHSKFAHLRLHGEWFVKDDRLHQFIKSLPRAEMLKPGVAEAWASEQGVALLPGKQVTVPHRRSDPDVAPHQ